MINSCVYTTRCCRWTDANTEGQERHIRQIYSVWLVIITSLMPFRSAQDSIWFVKIFPEELVVYRQSVKSCIRNSNGRAHAFKCHFCRIILEMYPLALNILTQFVINKVVIKSRSWKKPISRIGRVLPQDGAITTTVPFQRKSVFRVEPCSFIQWEAGSTVFSKAFSQDCEYRSLGMLFTHSQEVY